MINPAQFIQMIKNGSNPQQLMIYFLETQGISNTPMGMNLLNLARNGNTQEIEKIARNIMSQRGIDFDKEFTTFRKNLGV